MGEKANVGLVYIQGDAGKEKFKIIQFRRRDDKLKCECGSIKFIEFEKTQFLNGLTVQICCHECGLAYSQGRRGYELSGRGGTESHIYHGKYLIVGVHKEEAFLESERS